MAAGRRSRNQNTGDPIDGTPERKSSLPWLGYLILHHRPQPTATERSSLYSGYNKRILEQTFGGVVNLNNLPEQLQVISFTLNGRKCLVHNPDTKTTLNEWIRSQPGLKVSLPIIHNQWERYTDHRGHREKRLAEHNGSQCGFCSPGMVMNMYSLLKEDIKPSKDKIEESFDGNICRCTGYRPILDAMKSFAANADPIDIEELDRCASNSNNFSCSQNPVPCNTAGIKWYAAHSLAELYALLDHHSNDNVRMMAGNTGKGIFKDEGPVSVYIDINDVPELQKHLLSTIAGNLMLAHDHSNFPSDLVTIMSAIGGLVIVGKSIAHSKSNSRHLTRDLAGGAPISIVNMKDFLSLNMHRKVLLALAIPKLSDDFVVRSYKITPRSQLHATKTEEFLLNKRLTNPNTLKGALEILDEEIVPDPEFIAHNGSTVEYHKNLTKSLFYKFYVAALGSDASSRVRSAAGKILHERAVSSGRQSFDTKPARYPVSKPIPKLASKLQASGEAQYTDDIPFVDGELHAAFVISTLGNCKLDQIDTSEAMKMPGVVRFIDAKDIPGDNYYGNAFIPGPREGVFCERDVLYPGHALGVIIADTQRHADEAAVAVKIAYKDVKPPILSIQDAIKAKSFAEKCPWVRDINVGDVQGNNVSYHIWIHKYNVSQHIWRIRRLSRPVRLNMNFNTQLTMCGGRHSHMAKYKGTMEACEILNRRLAPVKEQMKKAPWPQMIASAALQKVDLSVKHMASNTIAGFYVSYGVALAEAEIDVLTGERLIKRCDILFDCGESINPDVDVGQVEGAFMMGVGLWLESLLRPSHGTGAIHRDMGKEKVYFDHHTGQELSTGTWVRRKSTSTITRDRSCLQGTWTYKPPTTKDIPIDFRVTLLKDAPNPLGVLNSKASGEPPATMACSCLFAVKHAIEAARKEIGKDQHFTLDRSVALRCLLSSGDCVKVALRCLVSSGDRVSVVFLHEGIISTRSRRNKSKKSRRYSWLLRQ
ncbi:predicted protein [Nematostella vectensis]|uniref:Aldehyde oxidase/xanthine dehydrogenase a/b hammerhead domain-containing protein n=1 Tax=Nematostella vectensis TaxID=45351 RepID=A7RK52_NEMVE|nr:predicted protein [Nematostella vectensis]|eukprot:XP_001640252.1 predicted protein [Nematostella vectensis]